MKADFVLDEMVYNTIMQGRRMHIKDTSTGEHEEKTIDYIKIVPRSPVIMMHFTDGTRAEASRDNVYCFEVNKKLVWKKGNRSRL